MTTALLSDIFMFSSERIGIHNIIGWHVCSQRSAVRGVESEGGEREWRKKRASIAWNIWSVDQENEIVRACPRESAQANKYRNEMKRINKIETRMKRTDIYSQVYFGDVLVCGDVHTAAVCCDCMFMNRLCSYDIRTHWLESDITHSSNTMSQMNYSPMRTANVKNGARTHSHVPSTRIPQRCLTNFHVVPWINRYRYIARIHINTSTKSTFDHQSVLWAIIEFRVFFFYILKNFCSLTRSDK